MIPASLTVRSALSIALALIAVSCSAAELTGRVVKVQDGDTITVLDANRTQHKIRLAGIDAPEAHQAFGTRSRQNLAGMVFGKDVLVEWNKYERTKYVWNKRDQDKRKIGVVLVNGHDVNLEQVRAGMAWWYRYYARDQTPDDRRFYDSAESEARAAKRGLWVDPAPMPPWEFRREGRNAR